MLYIGYMLFVSLIYIKTYISVVYSKWSKLNKDISFKVVYNVNL